MKNVFDFLNANNISIHFSSLNFLYFSTVDLIDSLIEATGIDYHPFYNRALKNDLYLCAKSNIEKFIDIFFRYSYPNIKQEQIGDFINELIEVFSKEQKSKGRDTILMLLNKSKNTDNLVFIMNEQDHILIENFAQFYSRSLYLFVNSKHIFDKEDSIEPLIANLDMRYKDSALTNYTFVDSKHNLPIQLSDIIIGFIGKFYNFLNEKNLQQIDKHIIELNKLQKEVLKGFFEIMLKSETKNKAFIFQTTSNDELEKLNYIRNFA